MAGGEPNALVRAFDALAARRPAAVVCVGVLAFVLAVAVSAIRVPEPRLHDEFSYLLAADTFAHGRLSNPTHPFWEHFETFHVLQQPSYASKYPPGQGLVLALGQRLGGHAIFGVWLSMGLAAAAVCWMLQGFVPARFALLGGVLVAFHHGLQFGWQNYWNGSLAIVGGALLYGAVPRLLARPRAHVAALLALGVALLANTRPFSGLVACVPVAVLLLVRAFSRKGPSAAQFLRAVVIPCVLVFAVVAAAMATYNAAVTGSAFRLPYQVHSEQYAHTPIFLWQEPRPAPDYRHAVMKDFYLGWQTEGYYEQQSLRESFARKRENLYFFVTPLLMVPLVSLPWVLRSRRNRFAALAVALVFGASLLVSGTHAHYIAPIAPLLFLLVVQGLRQVRLLEWRGRRVGRALVAAIVALQVVIFVAAIPLHAAQEPPAWSLARAKLARELAATPGRHLVLIHYAAGHSPHEEWVANAADIDASKVVWARAISRDRDDALIAYFDGRRVWDLHPDRLPVRPVERPLGPSD